LSYLAFEVSFDAYYVTIRIRNESVVVKPEVARQLASRIMQAVKQCEKAKEKVE
jgi:hypothetical protein